MTGRITGVGRWMIIAAWLLLIVLLTLIFSRMIDRLDNPNSTVEPGHNGAGVRTVELRRNRAGHYVASGKINDRQVTFLVDTGATDVALSAALADSLKLKRGRKFSSRTAS